MQKSGKTIRLSHLRCLLQNFQSMTNVKFCSNSKSELRHFCLALSISKDPSDYGCNENDCAPNKKSASKASEFCGSKNGNWSKMAKGVIAIIESQICCAIPSTALLNVPFDLRTGQKRKEKVKEVVKNQINERQPT